MQPARSWRWGLLFSALAATAVVSPMFFLGNASGHDFVFHVSSWMDVAHQWREGIFYPRLAEWANWGYGEPRFIFYPPLSWLLGAALGSVLPWIVVPIVYLWIVLTGSGLAMWRLAREWLAPTEAIAAAIFYVANPYQLLIVYLRSDFAELLAWALAPLLVLEAIRVARDGRRRIPFLAVVFAGIWLSNAPAGVIATYTLVLLLVVGCVIARSVRPLLRGFVAMASGFGLAAFYILPAAWERPWARITELVSASLNPALNFIFGHSSDPQFLLFNWQVSALACGMILVGAVAAVFFSRSRAALPWLWTALVALFLAAVFFMFPVSSFAWRLLPELRFLQFPWRWLGILAIPFACFVAGAFRLGRKQWIAWAAVAIVIAASGVIMVRNAWWDNDDLLDLAEGIRSGHGYPGMDEYSPPNCVAEMADPNASGCIVEPPGAPPRIAEFDPSSGAVTSAAGLGIHVEQWTAERKIFTESSNAPVTLALRALSYPAWRLRVDGQIVPAESADETAQLLLPLSPGTHRVAVRLHATWDSIVGEAISLATLYMLVVAWRRRTRHPQGLTCAQRGRSNGRKMPVNSIKARGIAITELLQNEAFPAVILSE